MTRSTINQVVQFGKETTPGTAVAANKRLDGAMVSLGIEADVAYYRGTGRKYNTVQELNREWSSGTLDESPLDFGWTVYPLSSIYGTPTIAASGASSTAKDWTFNASLSGNASPQTFSIEKGDSTTAEKVDYALFQQWGYKGTRQSFTQSGAFISRKVTKGATLTASPTVVPIAPINASLFDVYIDPDSTGLGTTKIVRPLSIEFTFDSVYNPAWYINTDYASWAEHVDATPNCTFKLMVVADTQGMALLDTMRDGSTQFIQVKAEGAEIDATNSINEAFVHNMAVKVGKPDKWADSDGLYAISWEFTIIEDATWGKAHQIILTNLLTAL